MPQLNPEFFVSQLFWLLVTFTFLVVFLWRISLPRISSVLEKRERKISEDLANAKELQLQAEKIQNSIEEHLKKARSDTLDSLKETTISLQENSMSELQRIDKELDRKINESSSLIEKNKKESINKIHKQIYDITKLTLEKVANFKVPDEDISKTIQALERKIN